MVVFCRSARRRPCGPVGRTVSREMSHLLDFDTLRSLLLTELVPALPEDVSPTTRDRYERVTADLRRREELHRRVISVINSMTAFERRYPLALHDESRQRRVASGAGVELSAIQDALHCLENHRRLLESILPPGERPLPYTAQMDPELCTKTHATLIAGNCPWCGVSIPSRNRPQSPNRA